MPIDCICAAELKIAGVVINGYNATEATVAEETTGQVITQCGGVNVLCSVPFNETVDIEAQSPGEVIIPSLLDCNWTKLAQN